MDSQASQDADIQTIQWYPGHIAKIERELKQRLTHVDVVIKLLDARIPLATYNKRVMDQLGSSKPVLLLLTKSDLADANQTQQWIDHYETIFPKVLSITGLQSKQRDQIIKAIVTMAKPVLDKLEAKGLKRRPVRAALIGMPNVGKSTLINMLVGKKKTKTGHRAGVTRGQQWVSIHSQVQLMDLPGLIPPQLDSQETGYKLASTYSVGDAAFDEETVAAYLLRQVQSLYPRRLQGFYKLQPDAVVTLESIAEVRGSVVSQGQADLKRTAQAVLKEFRLGRWGGTTLEHNAGRASAQEEQTDGEASPALEAAE